MRLPTGTMVNYYKVCQRKLWFFGRYIGFEKFDENVKIGKYIHESTFFNERRSIQLDEIAIDAILENGNTIILEIKKSPKLLNSLKYQLYYYLWYLKHHKNASNISIGYLVFPKYRKIFEVKLNENIEKEIEKIIEDIPKIISLPIPPPPIEKSYCKKCSYYDFCRV